MSHISVCSVSLTWTHLRGIHCFHMSLSKFKSYSQNTADVSWLLLNVITRDDLRDIMTGHWSQFSDLVCQVYLLPNVWVFRMVFIQKRGLFIFSKILIMEGSQNWPDLRSQISKYWDVNFTYANCYYLLISESLKVSSKSFSQRSYDMYSNFFWGEVTQHDIVTWPWVTWVRKFLIYRKDV